MSRSRRVEGERRSDFGRNTQFRDDATWVILCSGGYRDEAVLVGVRGGLGPGREPQLREDVADVPRDRLLADEQLGRDRAVGLARGDERQHLALAPAQSSRPRRARQPSEALEIGRGAQLLERAARRLELELGAGTVAELAAGDPDQQPDARRLMRRLEIAPRAMRRTELRQRRPWITFRQQDGAGRLSGESVQVRGVELRGDPGELIGRRPRAPRRRRPRA